MPLLPPASTGRNARYMRLPDEVVELAKIAPAEKKEPKGMRPRKAAGRGRGQVTLILRGRNGH